MAFSKNYELRPDGAYISPMPTDDELNQYYQEYFSTNDVYSKQESTSEFTYRINMCKIRHEIIKHNSGSFDTLLELGYGKGDFLNIASQIPGLSSRGIDFTLSSLRPEYNHLQSICKAGIPHDLLQELNELSLQFNVINATHVLEHSPDPHKLLEQLVLLLSPSGKLYLELPNDFSIFQSYLVDNGCVDENYWILPPDHLSYWNPQNFVIFAPVLDVHKSKLGSVSRIRPNFLS